MPCVHAAVFKLQESNRRQCRGSRDGGPAGIRSRLTGWLSSLLRRGQVHARCEQEQQECIFTLQIQSSSQTGRCPNNESRVSRSPLLPPGNVSVVNRLSPTHGA